MWVVGCEDELVAALSQLLRDPLERRSRGRAAAQVRLRVPVYLRLRLRACACACPSCLPACLPALADAGARWSCFAGSLVMGCNVPLQRFPKA